MTMKTKMFLFLCFASQLCFTACKKEFHGASRMTEPNGLMSAMLNNGDWITAYNEARYEPANPALFGFGSYIYVDGLKTQSLYFSNIDPNNSQPQALFSVAASQRLKMDGKTVVSAGFSNVDDDAALDAYQVIDSLADNFVVVDSYDPSTNKVKGRFNVKMLRDFNAAFTPGFEDTLVVKNGAYEFVLK
jgi:hypothetical protein